MLTIGITGGMGSGKTTICRIASTFGIAIYNSDQRSKELHTEDAELRAEVRKLLGDNTYDAEGKLNKGYVSQQIFNNKALLKELEHIVHPRVALDFKKWCAKQEEAGKTMVWKEAALLFEAGSYKELDKMILVVSPLELRLKRITARDKVDEATALARIAHQWTDKQKVPLADYVITSDDKQAVLPQFLKILEELNALAKSKMDA